MKTAYRMWESNMPRTAFWHQAFSFTCGAAALGGVLANLGWKPPRSRRGEELAIWRESTAVSCPGAHPMGLALAARARGWSARVRLDGPTPWIWDHIARRHPGINRANSRAIESTLRSECVRAGMRVDRDPHDGGRGFEGAGVLLVTESDVSNRRSDPHWIGLIARPHGTFVLDPLASRAVRSSRVIDAWWRCSGFDGTRSWVGLSSRLGVTA